MSKFNSFSLTNTGSSSRTTSTEVSTDVWLSRQDIISSTGWSDSTLKRRVRTGDVERRNALDNARSKEYRVLSSPRVHAVSAPSKGRVKVAVLDVPVNQLSEVLESFGFTT